MAVREVVQLGDPRLRTPATPVEDPSTPEIASLIADLTDTLADRRATTTYGRGIAASQIGSPYRVVLLNLDRPWPLINPVITARSNEEFVVWDACLSFLTVFFEVSRSTWIDVAYQDRSGATLSLRAEGDLSELLQHEIDHVDGVLAIDRIADIRTMCTRGEFERRHRDRSPYALC